MDSMVRLVWECTTQSRWNSGGLSFTQRNLCYDLGHDILDFTETHDNVQMSKNSNFIPAEQAPVSDTLV